MAPPPPRRLRLLALALGASALLWRSSAKDPDGCTSIAVSSGATADGSAMTSHSNDCQECDFRMAFVPARDHPPGSMRTIYDAVWGQYPRLVDTKRSLQYHAGAGINSSVVLGYIPEVPHTFALWESTYGLINEKGLGMGESTCAALVVGNGTQGPGTGGALFTIGNLMALALERCETARCAVQLMGDFGARYGFYGEDPGQPGAGEAATLADATGEAWIFHIAGGLPERAGSAWAGQRGALWAAQRVPDGHVAVVANNFIIRQVDPEDRENFILHPGLLDLAQEAGLWDGKGKFDFLAYMAPDLRSFSYNPSLPPIPYYTTMRMWAIFRHAAPSALIPITDNPADLPFSVKVDKKVTVPEVMDWFRNHYEGTEFDMRLGVLAGPWQSPNRIEGGQGQRAVPGVFARAFSIPRTSYTHVVQTRTREPLVWFAPDASASSVFVPFFASVLTHGSGAFDVPTFGEGSMKSFSFTDGLPNAWWAFDFVANWMDLCYKNMSETYVYPKVHALQLEVFREVEAALAATEAMRGDQAAKALAAVQTRLQRRVVEDWWALAGTLVVRYNDHFFNFPEWAPTTQDGIGYPAFWLEMIGYSSDSFRPTWVRKSPAAPTLLPAAELALLEEGRPAPPQRLAAELAPGRAPESAAAHPVVRSVGAADILLCLLLLASNFLSFRLGRRQGRHEAASELLPAPAASSPYVRMKAAA